MEELDLEQLLKIIEQREGPSTYPGYALGRGEPDPHGSTACAEGSQGVRV